MGLDSNESGKEVSDGAALSWPDEGEVASAANDGSFSKAVWLLKAGAARVLIRRADGAVEVAVQSEKGSEEYAVQVPRPQGGPAAAKCTCFDYRRRGGLCKHGAAALLHLLHGGVGPVSRPAPDAVPAPLRPAKRPRTAVRAPSPSGARPRSPGVCTESKPALPVPCFPRVGSHEQAGAQAQAQPQRRGALKAAMAARRLKTCAAAGDGDGFGKELRQWGDAPLEEPLCLLRAALQGGDDAGAAGVVAAVLARPEGAAAANAANGTTLLHMAVTSGRVGICRALALG